VLVLLWLLGDFINVEVGGLEGPGMQPNEPAIAISRAKPDRIVIGANPNRFYFSDDGGKSWRGGYLKSKFGVWGDPALVAAPDGTFYYFHLANPRRGFSVGAKLERIVCQKSTDGGESWQSGGSFGFRKPRDQDKEWAAIDPETGTLYVTWTEFDTYGSRNPKARSRILFSRTTAPDEWSKAIVISDREGTSRDDGSTAEGAVPAVTPDGTVHVAWALDEHLYYDRSTDAGETWGRDKKVATIHGGWDFRVPGLLRCNGQPVLLADRSAGLHSGSLYLVWSDQRNGDTDVWLVISRDGGKTWSPSPKRVNGDEAGHHQFFAWPAVDQTTGHLYVLFYDRRRGPGNRTEVFLATSRNGGQTFGEKTISEKWFLPRSRHFLGDYINVDAHGGRVAAVWTRMDNGRTSIWVAVGRGETL